METIGRYDAPSVLLSYSQVQFQLAECMGETLFRQGPALAKTHVSWDVE